MLESEAIILCLLTVVSATQRVNLYTLMTIMKVYSPYHITILQLFFMTIFDIYSENTTQNVKMLFCLVFVIQAAVY